MLVVLWNDIIKIINVLNSCDVMVQIFSWWERSNVLFNDTFHLSPHENICTITRMKNVHYLFYITTKVYFCHFKAWITFIYWKTPILFRLRCVKSKVTEVQLNAAHYHCTVLLNADVTCVQYSIHFISCDPVSSNQMTRICIGVIWYIMLYWWNVWSSVILDINSPIEI